MFSQSKTEYLQTLLKTLSDIKTATYFSESSSSAPGDSLAFITYKRFVQMYINPADTFIGASFSSSFLDDVEKFDLCYDGNYEVRFNWDNKTVQIDTLTNDRRRPLMPPFFITVKSLFEYAIKNIDSSKIDINIFQDSTKINFTFSGKVVEFIGLATFICNIPYKVSRYVVLIDNKNNLPYKYIRKMPHQTSSELCTDIKVSNEKLYEFVAARHIPVDFTIVGREPIIEIPNELEGQAAPVWNLKETNGDSISLNDLKSKILLLQFTGIGCGPCHASLPFLEQLLIDLKNEDFELLSIETWSNNLSGIQRYKELNGLKYKFLLANKEVKTEYKVSSVPSFFILDEKHIIRKVIFGYEKGVTDKMIRTTINQLL